MKSLILAAAMASTLLLTPSPVKADGAQPTGYVCRARDVIGRVFTAEAASEAEASAQAIDACQAVSLICYSTACDPVTQ